MEPLPYIVGSAGTSSGFIQPTFIPTFACLLSTYSVEGERDYSGYQVLRVFGNTTKEAFGVIQGIYESDAYDFWSRPSRTGPTDVSVPEQKVQSFKSLLETAGVEYEVMINDLERIVRDEKLRTTKQGGFNWYNYHRLNVIQTWQKDQAKKYPDIVSAEVIGKSFEGRALMVTKISTGGENKSAIWIDGGIHAREWISPATVTFIANELITGYKTRNPHIKRLVETFDWYILPNVNPDGYEYTWTTDRMWRKTRSVHITQFAQRSPWEQLFGCCKGTDPNRNFEHQWGGKGTSKNKCSDIYHGPKAASESEVKAVQDFVFERRDQMKLFLTVHSYSQLILLPWGYDQVRTEDHDELMTVANKAAKKLQAVHGTNYRVGPSPEILYPAAGGSEDWAKGVAGIKFAYCYELRDEGRYGFLLPASQILATGQETFAGVRSMAEDMIDYFKLEAGPESTTAQQGEVTTEETTIGAEESF